MTAQHEPAPFVAYTIRKTAQGRFAVAGWHNRAVALWACEPETQHLWNGSQQFGQPIAETSEITGAHAALPNDFTLVEGTHNETPEVELWIAP
jgi:hypothetical protein